MPTGYAGEGKVYNKALGRWEKKNKEQTYDYSEGDVKSIGLLVSFFRWYPDYFADVLRDKNAKYGLELPQRLMMRAMVRFKDAYITGVRGLTKTYVLILSKMIEGVLFPGKKIRYVAPNQKQSAKLASQTFLEISRDYPLLASMWLVNHDRDDMFKITTIHGSEFSMYATRGDTADELCGEECGQESPDAFDIDYYLSTLYPSIRGQRKVNQKIDPNFISEKHTQIGNATSRTHKAYLELRKNCYRDMKDGESSIVLDISWVSALLCNLRSIEYFKGLKRTLSPESWLRECCALYTGSGENPLLDDETILRSSTLRLMENHHCGDKDAIYIVSHDVSYAGGSRNAQCADAVLKLTRYQDNERRDRYRKQVVYVDSYSPLPTYYLQSQKVKNLWKQFCLDGGQATYLVVDVNSNGDAIGEELMKPMGDGMPTLCSIDHSFKPELEQSGALPVFLPMKAGTKGAKHSDGEMIKYAQAEFTQGNVELLITNVLDGIECYKKFHNIKDINADRQIKIPYDKTNLLRQQISNLKAEVSGMTLKEKRKSAHIQRDIWSAVKYALRMAQILEEKITVETYRKKSGWAEYAQNYTSKRTPKNNLLSLRKFR